MVYFVPFIYNYKVTSLLHYQAQWKIKYIENWNNSIILYLHLHQITVPDDNLRLHMCDQQQMPREHESLNLLILTKLHRNLGVLGVRMGRYQQLRTDTRTIFTDIWNCRYVDIVTSSSMICYKYNFGAKIRD